MDENLFFLIDLYTTLIRVEKRSPWHRHNSLLLGLVKRRPAKKLVWMGGRPWGVNGAPHAAPHAATDSWKRERPSPVWLTEPGSLIFREVEVRSRLLALVKRQSRDGEGHADADAEGRQQKAGAEQPLQENQKSQAGQTEKGILRGGGAFCN